MNTVKPMNAKPRSCVVCGCTEERACPGRCAWIEPDVDVCTACPHTPAAMVEICKKEQAIIDRMVRSMAVDLAYRVWAFPRLAQLTDQEFFFDQSNNIEFMEQLTGQAWEEHELRARDCRLGCCEHVEASV